MTVGLSGLLAGVVKEAVQKDMQSCVGRLAGSEMQPSATIHPNPPSAVSAGREVNEGCPETVTAIRRSRGCPVTNDFSAI